MKRHRPPYRENRQPPVNRTLSLDTDMSIVNEAVQHQEIEHSHAVLPIYHVRGPTAQLMTICVL